MHRHNGRVALTCCRAGVSGLRVDTGRWEYVHLGGGRICLLCGSAVEDVKHLVLDCPVYQEERDRMICDIASHIKDAADIVVDGVITDPDLFF